jgi:hypothetical protein
MIWTEEKIEKLIELYPIKENSELSEILGIKRGTIVAKANNLGLYKSDLFMKFSREKRPQFKKTEWSIDDENFILDNYKIMSNYEISLRLDKTKRSVIRKINMMGIKRSKEDVDFLRSKKSKENGRDLSYDFVREQALKCRTRSEFSFMDNSSYCKAKKLGWMEEYTHLRIGGNVSIPQLILMDILENFLGIKCSYNDREAIKPLEIDCYFDKWMIGWEYNGRRFHTDTKDQIKKNLCMDSGIKLFTIDEKSECYRDYTRNIKNQLMNQIDDIKDITGIQIKELDLLEYEPILNFLFRLSREEIKKCQNKKISEIKKIDPELYRKIKKYNLIECSELNILNDIKFKKFNNIEDHIEYLTKIKHRYKSFSELAKNEHLYRKIKTYGVTLDYIKERINFNNQ